MFENEKFETFLLINFNLKFLSRCMSFVWDHNDRLQALLPYIDYLHNDEPSWHISMDSIVFDTFHGLVELLIAMTKLNKYVVDPFFIFQIKLDLKDFVFIPLCILKVDGVGSNKT